MNSTATFPTDGTLLAAPSWAGVSERSDIPIGATLDGAWFDTMHLDSIPGALTFHTVDAAALGPVVLAAIRRQR